MDTVFIQGLAVRGRHGVEPHERTDEQDFIVDIEATCDATKAAASDNLDDAVNYVVFEEIVNRIVGSHSYYLIEKLAETIATELLNEKRIQKIRITIRKPSVLASGVPGITIERTQA